MQGVGCGVLGVGCGVWGVGYKVQGVGPNLVRRVTLSVVEPEAPGGTVDTVVRPGQDIRQAQRGDHMHQNRDVGLRLMLRV